MSENERTESLPPELWLGKAAHRNVGEVKVFQNEKEAVGWVKGSNPFSEVRCIWRVGLEVREMYQSHATVERPELT